ncbi:MAG TPA: 6-pyruvoyl-tetrahydropterin synthase-related protein [Pyrinomonadaceae bacterium]|nr:6-pyruvoyl-tetrahydropterin synthase-related protein [Pyrinomonadaceae bacterium]
MKTFFVKFLQDEKSCILIVAAVAVAVMLPVLIVGLPYGYDLPHHYQCAMTFYESILSGDFYPSWSLNRNFGYGGMEARLYPPISHYSLAVFYLITGSWHIGSWLVLTLFSFLGGYSVYLWAREYMPANQAAFAGSIYVLLPYHLNQVYNTFFYAEFVGSSLLPFTFVFVSRVCRRGKTSDVVGLAASFAVLILTHLPLTVIGAICFTIYGLSLLRREKIFSQIVKLAIGVSGGLAASSFFWIKVIQERDLLAKTIIYPDPWLDYRLHFLLTPIQTFTGDLQTSIYDSSTVFYDLMLLYTVVLALGCTVPFLIWLKRKDNLTGVWLVFAVSVFLAIPASRFVWDASSLLQEVQFPWRWLSIVSITASVLSASKLNYLGEWFKSKKRPLGLLVVGSILFVAAFSIGQIMRQAPFLPKDGIAAMMEENARAKGFTFWWTIWTKEEAFKITDKVLVANRDVQIEKWTATERNFQISAGETENARIAVFYHPNWTAAVDEIAIETKPDENGVLQISLPTEISSVKIYFQETSTVMIAQWISCAVWLFLLFAAILQTIKPKFNRSRK